MKSNNFSYLVKQGVVSVWRNRMMSFASFCIIMVSLLMVSIAVLISMDIGVVIGSIEDKNEVLVYVDGSVSEERLAKINDEIATNKYVEKVSFYSKEEAWEDKKKELSDYAELFDYLDENPMPDTYRATINDLSKIKTAVKDFEAIEGVESVTAPYDFASFLVTLRTTLTLIGTAVVIALVVVCLVIVYNSTRTSVFARRKEINIMRHVGATNAFIKTPFFIEGMFIGMISGVVAWLLTKVTYESVVNLFSDDLTLWKALGIVDIIPFGEVTWYVLGGSVVVGALLGALGTVLSTGKHLKV